VAPAMHHVYPCYAVPTGSRSGTGRSPPGGESRERRHPGRDVDCADYEYRWKPAHRPRVLSRLLRDWKCAVSGSLLLPAPVVDIQSAPESKRLVQTDGARGRHDLLRGDHRGGYRGRREYLLASRERPRANDLCGEPGRHGEFRER